MFVKAVPEQCDIYIRHIGSYINGRWPFVYFIRCLSGQENRGRVNHKHYHGTQDDDKSGEQVSHLDTGRLANDQPQHADAALVLRSRRIILHDRRNCFSYTSSTQSKYNKLHIYSALKRSRFRFFFYFVLFYEKVKSRIRQSRRGNVAAAYFFLDTPTVRPRRPVVLVCWPRTRRPQ